jgi:hypothetical protein
LAGRRIHVSTRVEFFNLLDQGYTVEAASRAVGISVETGYRWKKVGFNLGGAPDHHTSGSQNRKRRIDLSQSEPVSREYLSVEARQALEDFDYFRLRYFGRRATPWQKRAADEVVEMLAGPHDEYVVMNEPPGSGKSTWGHDMCVWLIARDRTIRELLGSATQRLADKYSNRIRKTLERTRPLPAIQGCVKAEAALSQDYGRFKPIQAEGQVWTRSEFTVAQQDTEGVEDKEPTVSAYGMDTEFIGHRANLVLWDDLVTRQTLRNPEQVENQRSWWAEYGETRLEPGGLLLLVGQRMGADDLYRHCLDMEIPEELVHIVGREKKYRHIIFPAHFEDECKQDHGKDAKPWPEGCLLDPVRLPWTKLATIQQNRSEAYRVQYQQEDVDPAEVLVPKIWIDGGRDPQTGEQFPGCWDNDRDVAQIPKNLAHPLVSYATADPSPTKFWSIQWWLYQPSTNQRFLLDLIRQSMDSPDFLDWNENAGVFFGVMQEWQERSKELNAPISHWIVEVNAAQRFILQHDHVRRWQRLHGVQIVGHSTHRNKTDPDYGVQSMKNIYRFGQVRLPGKGTGRLASLKLIDEVTRYPNTMTDDCMMAQWFGEHAIKNGSLHNITNHKPIVLRRPSWIRKKVAA